MSGEDLVLVERSEGGIAKLTLNNPPLNLVTLEMAQRLIEALEGIEEDESVRVVIVTGAGDRAFSGFETLSKPVIAAIEGLRRGV